MLPAIDCALDSHPEHAKARVLDRRIERGGNREAKHDAGFGGTRQKRWMLGRALSRGE